MSKMSKNEDSRIQPIIDDHTYVDRRGVIRIAGISDNLDPSLITNANSVYNDDLYGPSYKYEKQNRDYYRKTERWFQRWKGQWISLVDVSKGNHRQLIQCKPVRYDRYNIILQI